MNCNACTSTGVGVGEVADGVYLGLKGVQNESNLITSDMNNIDNSFFTNEFHEQTSLKLFNLKLIHSINNGLISCYQVINL